MTAPVVSPDAVTPRWLEAVLAGGGVQARVRDFAMTRIGTGQIGQSLRFDLQYADAPDDAPASLVGKFPAPEPESRNAGVALGNYAREVNFYRRLAGTALISLPKCYAAEFDPATDDFILMMEDLSPAEQGDQLRGCTLDQARLAVLEAANLHASHWDDPAIDALPWVSGAKAAPPAASAAPGALAALWDGFCARYGDRVEADMRRVGAALVAGFDQYESGYDGPKSLVHIDYRPDNMMFASPRGGRALTVLDWQSVSYGCGVTDVAYFLAGALPRDVRRAAERELLAEYHDRLAQLGVRYDLDRLWDDYRSRAFALFLVAFYAAMLVTQTPRGDDMFFAMLRGATDQALDLDALAFLR